MMGIQQHLDQRQRSMEAAFKTNKGLFEPTIMFFGLCNSPAMFQSMMDSIFEDLIDNFLFAKTPLELENNTKHKGVQGSEKKTWGQIFFRANFTGLTNLHNQAHVYIW